MDTGSIQNLDCLEWRLKMQNENILQANYA